MNNFLSVLNIPSHFSKIVSRNLWILPLSVSGRNITSRFSSIDKPGDKSLADRFRNLPRAQDNVFHTYIWIDGTGQNVRAKCRVATKEPTSISEIPCWHFDGSSTYQAKGAVSDLTLKPVAMCPDPFFVGKSKLVLCDVYDAKGNPVETNHRTRCVEALKQCESDEPWFGLEQEYTLMGTNGMPFGFPENGFPEPQGPYYCSVGAGRTAGRDVCDAHMLACRYAGLMHGGTNAEVLLGQWEYQIGPCSGVEAGDHLWLSRYILERIAEEFGLGVSLDPKPVPGDWNGTGMHCNFSTKAMREDGGLKLVTLLSNVKDDPKGGEDNKRRMTGLHETARIDEFTAGAGLRTASIRIPAPVEVAGKGWLEDRRPSANADPYCIVNSLVSTCCLNH